MSSSRSRRSGDGLASVSRGSEDGKDHTYLTVKLPSSKLRQATSSKQGASISVNNQEPTPKRSTRGGKKSYVVESDSDDDEDDVGEDVIQVGAPAATAQDGDDNDEDMHDVEDDAEGDDIDEGMDLDAEGDDDEDVEADEDVDITPPVTAPAPAPSIKIQKPRRKSPESKKTRDTNHKRASAQTARPNDSDDEELSELDSDEEMEVEEDPDGDEDDEDMDAEGEDIDEDQDVEGRAGPGPRPSHAGQEARALDSDDESAMPNHSARMTVRQRARFEELDESHYQALSNEVQAKKVFTVEEKAMRRAEMARRRRNLSEKRNEEVKQETINKLLKKQANKTNRKGGQVPGEEVLTESEPRPNPIFIRWVSNKDGERVSVPHEILQGPAGQVFANSVRPAAAGSTAGGGPRKLIEEVS